MLRCSTDIRCDNHRCMFHWERETNHTFEKKNYGCSSVYTRYQERYSVYSGPDDWSLTITGVQPSDVRRYRCSIYSYGTNSWAYSLHATLIIPSLIDISVQPPSRPTTTGANATFHCNVQSRRGALPTFEMNWFVNGTDVRRFQDQSLYHLDNNRYTLTILNIKVNPTHMYCKAFVVTEYVKRSDNYLILIYSPNKQKTSAIDYLRLKSLSPSTRHR